MPPGTTHRIRVLGRDIQVRSSASPETVREVEDFVNGKLAEVAAAVKNCDFQVVAILTLMNIAESYLAQARENAAYREVGRERVPQLLRRINERLTGS
jgi:cell division protein ZapA